MSNRTQDSQRDDDKQRHMNSEDRHIENDKRKNHFENEQDQQIMHQSKYILSKSKHRIPYIILMMLLRMTNKMMM